MSSQALEPPVVFDDAAVRIIGEAFDAACKELPYIGLHPVPKTPS
jgi:hypothetical protein